jgi:Fe-S cluster biogenesis protein NfuA
MQGSLELRHFDEDELMCDDLAARVERVLGGIRPAMAPDGGGVELVSATNEEVVVRLIGACRYCPSQSLTIAQTVVPAIARLDSSATIRIV